MTETSPKGVLRSTTVMFLFVGLVGIWMGGCQTQEQKEIKRLIIQLQDQNWGVRVYTAEALGQIGSEDAVPALIPLLQDPEVRVYVAEALERIKKSQPETTDDADFDLLMTIFSELITDTLTTNQS